MSKPPSVEDIDVVSDEYMRVAGMTSGANRRLSICRALGKVYLATDNEEFKLLLRYASTIARHYVYKIREHDPEWVRIFCPRYGDFDKIMRWNKNEDEGIPG